MYPLRVEYVGYLLKSERQTNVGKCRYPDLFRFPGGERTKEDSTPLLSERTAKHSFQYHSWNLFQGHLLSGKGRRQILGAIVVEVRQNGAYILRTNGCCLYLAYLILSIRVTHHIPTNKKAENVTKKIHVCVPMFLCKFLDVSGVRECYHPAF